MPQPQPQGGTYKCNSCGATFKTEAELKEHNNKMHMAGSHAKGGGQNPKR